MSCFVTYEERTRTVTVEHEDGTITEEEETYTVAVSIEDLEVIYQNIRSTMGVEATEDQRSNAESIYSLIRYGYTGGSSFEGAGCAVHRGGRASAPPLGGELAERGQPYRPHHGRAAGPYRHAPCNAYRRLDPCCPAGNGDGILL